MEQNPLLKVENLKTFFRTRRTPARAVDGVSFNVYPGETFAIVGESGSGKSVTALSIMQLLPQSSSWIAGGRIIYNGTDISTLPPVRMREIRGNDISMIFQRPMTALNPVFTIENQITDVLRLHRHLSPKDASRRALEMLDEVGISEPEQRLKEYPHQLSGGMRQRVMIAIALACNPKLLIADEPTTALDVTIQAQILDLMKKLQKEHGTSIILITHDMAVVRETADRVGVMYAGRMVETGSVEAIFKKPAHPYTELLMKSLPTAGHRGKQLETIEGLVPAATEIMRGCRFHNRCPLKMDICPSTPVPETELEPEHFTHCHLFNHSINRREKIVTALNDAPASVRDPETKVLKVENLKMHFPIKKGLLKRTVAHVKAVDGISLCLHKGETLALVGESGCGKTTVGKSIIRLLDPNGGSIIYKGINVVSANAKEMKPLRKTIQFVFQDPQSSLNPRMLVKDILIEGMQTHGIGRNNEDRLNRAESLMDDVGLHREMIHRYPHEFSGGQQQRIVLARALSSEPEVLICDEATSALDVSVQAQILNLLKELQSKRGLSYIFITHNMSVVEYLSDRVAVMYLGRIVEEALTEEIFKNPKHPYTIALLSAVPKVDESTRIKQIRLDGDVPSPVNPPDGCHFNPRCPYVKDPCRSEYPAEISISKTHRCKCVLYNQPSES